MKLLPKTPRTARWMIAGALSLSGAITMIVILAFMGDFDGESGRMIISAAAGAGLAGFVFAGLFGQIRKSLDWGLFAVGAVLSTVLGSFLGGTIWGALIAIFEGVPQNEFLLIFLLRTGALAFMVVMMVMPTEHILSVAIWAVIMLMAQMFSIWARAQRTAA